MIASAGNAFPATLLIQILHEIADNIAHQDPSLPVEPEIRRTVVKRMAMLLEEKFLKEVSITYI